MIPAQIAFAVVWDGSALKVYSAGKFVGNVAINNAFVPDGTYTLGLGVVSDGKITFVHGSVTALEEASQAGVVSPVPDGTYTLGLGIGAGGSDGKLIFVGGQITALQEASQVPPVVISPIPDGTYTIGFGVSNNGQLTFASGRVTAAQEAS